MKTTVLVLMLFVSSAFGQITVRSDKTVDSGNWRRDTSSSSTTWRAHYMPSLGRDFSYQLVPVDFDSSLIHITFNYSDTAAFASNRAKGFPLPFLGTSFLPSITFPQVKYGRDTVWVKAPNGTIYFQYKF